MRRFATRVLLFLLPAILLVSNYFLLTIRHEHSGDLGGMEMLFVEKGYHARLGMTPETLYVNDVDIERLPDSLVALCFGDSFSNRHPYSYLQPIGERLGAPVTNVLYNLDFAPEEAALGFLTNAPMEQMPQIIIVESVERDFIPRTFWLDFDNPPTIDQLQSGKKHFGTAPRKRIEIEIAGYYKKRLGMNMQSMRTRLDKDFFSARGKEDVLMSYYKDTIHYPTEYYSGVVENLERLRDIALKRGVGLVYMAAPNKSTVYSPYIVGEDPFYTALATDETFDTLPFMLNPIGALRAMAERGVKDIYYYDDTHWSPAIAKAVGEMLSDLIIKDTIRTRNN